MLRNRSAVDATTASAKPEPATSAGNENKNAAAASEDALWGRRSKVSAVSGFFSLIFTLCSPTLILIVLIALEHFDGSLYDAALGLLSSASPVAFFRDHLPAVSAGPATAFASWVLLQSLLYWLLPGRIAHGPPTPGGNVLPYRMNGLLSWFVTVGAWVAVFWYGGLDAGAYLAENWMVVIIAANAYGLLVSVLALIKGHVLPSFELDRRFSGSISHDFLAGIELNPRVGRHWDMKLLHIGRLGMNSWVVIDLSFMAQQYIRFGSVSNSMLGVTLLHGIYVVDYFVNEEWYLSTIDIAHDHFGFYLGWGSTVWLPVIYTSQAQYLSSHFVQLPPFAFGAILTVGVLSYVLFRLANYQKHILRQTKGNCKIAGAAPRVIEAEYTTAGGKVHKSLLLVSGCWGLARHPNYTGDIVFSFCVCICCGWAHILPHLYFLWMSALLIHRCYRDERRCSGKYGAFWDEYQRTVRWRLIPGIF